MKRKNSILAIFLAVLMVIAMLPAITQEAYAGEKPVDFTQFIDGLNDGNLVIGTTISVNVYTLINAYPEMNEAYSESGEVYVSLVTQANNRYYFDYDSSSWIANLTVTGDMAQIGKPVEVWISLGSEHFYTTGIYAVADNTLDVKGKTVTIKYSKLRKKPQYLDVSKIISFVDEGQGEKTYTLASATKIGKSYKKYFKINDTTGKLMVKKGLKRGIYQVEVKVKAAGENNAYLAAGKTAYIRIKVK